MLDTEADLKHVIQRNSETEYDEWSRTGKSITGRAWLYEAKE